MSLNRTQTLNYVKAFDLKNLFIQELGWDNPKLRQSVPLQVEADSYNILPIAEKAGMIAFNHRGELPERKIRLKIYKETAKKFHELLIVFTDNGNTEQRWLWMRREQGKPDAARESVYSKGQDGELLYQKLQALAFTFAEEETGVSILDATRKAKKAFDVDTVTRKFYDRFQKEHAQFLKLISGITGQGDREWYASLMLNRLMFIYFIQKKRFLDGDENYLRNRLEKMQTQHGSDQFYSFYRLFLLRLFHEGLGNHSHSPELSQLLGKVPYLNGGLFDVHQLERENTAIQIPDEAFVRVFQFFDEFNWHLDERPLKNDREINPDVLGYIFEKYINQKQMGAYYTKEDITEYISKNTIIPFLFDKAQDISSNDELKTGIWQLLTLEPDRYIYEAVRKGAELPLPPEIAAGLNDVAQRGGWNKPAPPEYALPTEWWREVVVRRTRYQELKAKLVAGEVTSINDLITYNLNIRQFAQDVIESCEWPETVQAFYQAISRVTVLDPTCGSGAFLFAALGILEPLYRACLDRMEVFVKEAENSPRKLGSAAFGSFAQTLKEMAKHPNPRYFILKSIIINNLYGVDIMEEAVEIAKLRLFLKLVAQLDDPDHIEPLPDVDFNIRAGNTLVGFASEEQVQKAITGSGQGRMDLFSDLPDIMDKARNVERWYKIFREAQTNYNFSTDNSKTTKHQLQDELGKLRQRLDVYLAGEYGINRDKLKKGYEAALQEWQDSHQPFHWFVEFYGIMQDGGFDVIIGNPPYVEYSKVRDFYTVKDYKTEKSGNLYSFIVERSLLTMHKSSILGLIIPTPSICTERMASLQDLFSSNFENLYISNYDATSHPGILFVGVQYQLSIIIGQKRYNEATQTKLLSTIAMRWAAEERFGLFDRVVYTQTTYVSSLYSIPKFGSSLEVEIMNKLLSSSKNKVALEKLLTKNANKVFYRNAGNVYFRVFLTKIPNFTVDGKTVDSSTFKVLNVTVNPQGLAAILSSNIYYWWWSKLSDIYHVVARDLLSFQLPLIEGADLITLTTLFENYQNDLFNKSKERTYKYPTGLAVYQELYPRNSKPFQDEIDRVLAQHYGFTDEELDFIINYDIKYRMGRDSGEEEE